MASMEIACTVVGVIGNVASFCLFIATFALFWNIFWTGTVGERFSGIPYLAILMNCVLWVIYGLYPHSTLILIINGAGILFELLYLGIALAFSTRRTQVTIMLILLAEWIIIGGVLIWIHVGVPRVHKIQHVLGWMCVASGIIMYASTAPTLMDAWRTKNTDDVPLMLTLVGVASTIVWLSYGILKRNIYILTQNSFGLILCALQLAFYVIIRRSSRSSLPPRSSIAD